MQKIKRFLIVLGVLAALYIFATVNYVVGGLKDLFGRADIALVLDSRVKPEGIPTPRLRARLDRTVELYRAGYFRMIITSGGTSSEGVQEAFVMRDYLVARGIPAENILADTQGDSTYASARNAATLLRRRNGSSIFVVTQYFHVPRTQLALQRFGVENVFYAHAHWFELRDFYSAPRELLAYIYYYFRDY